MRIKSLAIALSLMISLSAYSQEFGTLSGTFRFGGGMFGTGFSVATPLIVTLLKVLPFTNWGDSDLSNWSNEQHGVFRFMNVTGDVLIPMWSLSSSNFDATLRHSDSDFFGGGQYTYSVGYHFSWKSPFSRVGLFWGADYEWKNFAIHYPYPNVSHNKIQAIVPTLGARYRLISPAKEIEGFPFNISLEAGISYVINTSYKNFDDYGIKALNNGFRAIVGIAVTTNRFGSLHVRWTKDLYNLFKKNYEASSGFLFNNEITTNFSCFSIGWAIFI